MWCHPLRVGWSSGCPAPELQLSFGFGRGRWTTATMLLKDLTKYCVEQKGFFKYKDAVRGTPQHELSSKTMALFTSDCGATRSLSIRWP